MAKSSSEECNKSTCAQLLAEGVRLAKKEAKAAQSLILKEELRARRRVLRRLDYIDADGVVSKKGQVAAEIQSADELVMTELIFNGVFNVRRWQGSRDLFCMACLCAWLAAWTIVGRELMDCCHGWPWSGCGLSGSSKAVIKACTQSTSECPPQRVAAAADMGNAAALSLA